MSALPARAVPVLLPAAGVLLLAWLIALASRSAPLWGVARTGHADRGALFIEVTVVCGAAVAIALLVVVLLHRRRARLADPPTLNDSLLRALPFASVGLAVLALLVIASAPLDGERDARPGQRLSILGSGGLLWLLDPREPPVVESGRGGDADPTRDPARRSVDVWVLLLLGALMLGIGVVLARRARAAESIDEDDEPESNDDAPSDQDLAELHASMRRTIDAMLADPDPRTAIIGAYARLLDALAECHVPRLPHEAPLEHLYRALVRLRVRPEPLRRLIGLFEVARFSTHRLTPAHRDAALDALRAAAADLDAAVPTEPAGALR